MGDRLTTVEMAQNRHGLKSGGAAVPHSVGGAESHVTKFAWAEAYLRTKWHLDPSNHLVTVHQCYRQTDMTDSDPVA